MNTLQILHDGHQTVLQAVDGLESAHWEGTPVVGVWSTKHVIAHLASFELVLLDVLAEVRGGEVDTPVLEEFRAEPARFNDAQVASRERQAPDEVLSEYTANCEQALALARTLPPEVFSRNGLLDWYGNNYDLDDFVTYMFYGHKREHSAQIVLFRKTLG